MSREIYQCPECGEEWSKPHCPKCAERRKAHSLQRLCSAAALCAELAVELDKRATSVCGKNIYSGEYGNLCHDAEIMRLAQRVFEREQQQNAALSEAAGKETSK